MPCNYLLVSLADPLEVPVAGTKHAVVVALAVVEELHELLRREGLGVKGEVLLDKESDPVGCILMGRRGSNQTTILARLFAGAIPRLLQYPDLTWT